METLRLKEVSQLVRCPDFWGGGGGAQHLGQHKVFWSVSYVSGLCFSPSFILLT